METISADRWIVARLKNDATLMGLVTNVYQWPVPPEATLPYVLFQEQTPVDIRPTGKYRIGVRAQYLIRVVAEATGWGGALEQAAERLDALLDAQAGPAPDGGHVWACVREYPFRLVEPTERGQYRHLGGLYRLYVQ